ncbi:hypothetical protein E2542_SST23390 [Spatholobus suberectus]|nr:hypothetical protein E2542_SST23390 [Spatholobus suberectus]
MRAGLLVIGSLVHNEADSVACLASWWETWFVLGVDAGCVCMMAERYLCDVSVVCREGAVLVASSAGDVVGSMGLVVCWFLLQRIKSECHGFVLGDELDVKWSAC